MSHSKNDFPIMGGTGRQVTKPYRGSYDAFYKLINPNTKKPYTNAELAAELEHRQQEYSVLAQLITPDLEEIQKRHGPIPMPNSNSLDAEKAVKRQKNSFTRKPTRYWNASPNCFFAPSGKVI
ncbi:hypothetical protein [uncultured Allofournierella sp.]|uniref:hypothetical protein n=1 Tax=uncultured Allofournierella sp. TaxID=1940258 RepID=UPI0025DEBB3B|nr:hypothetical protein [uncultured Fournierella sp.]